MPRRVLAVLLMGLVAAGLLVAPAPQRAAATDGAEHRAGHPAAPTTTATATATATATPSETAAPVLLVGVTGLRWDDVSTLATPALWDLSRRADVGLLAARSANGVACPADGWLAVSAGARSADTQVADRTCRTLREPQDGVVPGWQDYLDAAAQQQYDAQPGLLGDLLAEQGITATGIGPGAGIALADSTGRPVGTHVLRPAADALADTVSAALDSSQVVVVDVGTIRDSGWATRPRNEDELLPPADPTGEATEDLTPGDTIGEPTRAEQVRLVDQRIAEVLDGLGSRRATVLVVSLADSGRGALQLAAATGSGSSIGAGDELLTSGATRQPGLIQALDVTPTLLAALGLGDAAPALPGAVISTTPGPDTATERLALLRSITAEATWVTRVAGDFTTRLVLVQALLFGAAALLLTRPVRSVASRRAMRALQVAALALGSAPIASFLTGLVPWWLSARPTTAFWLVLLGWVAVITAVALAGPWRRQLLGPAGVVAGVTVLVLAVDLVTGSTLVIDSPMGAHRLLAARFYGASNQAFALLTGAGLLLAVVLADVLVRAGRRRLAAAAVAVTGLVVVVVDGTPGLGSDFGGPPALILAFALLTLVVAEVKVSWRTVLLVVAGAAVVVGAFTLVDWLRPADERTHLGRFLATVLDGGLWDVLGRKLSANLRVLTNWRYLVLAVAGAALTTLVIAGPRPGRGRLLGSGTPLAGLQREVPLLRPAVVAIGVALGIGFIINDSGIVVPATGIAVAVPCLVAAAAQWRLAHRHDPAGPPVPAAAPSAAS